MLIRRCVLLLVLIAFAGSSPAAEFSGKVMGISDGDTITVLKDNRCLEKWMNTIVVQLPTSPAPTDATLYYDRDYSKGRHHLDYLHLIKEGLFFNAAQRFDPDVIEEAYWADLDKYRHQFVAAIPSGYDLIVDTPSVLPQLKWDKRSARISYKFEWRPTHAQENPHSLLGPGDRGHFTAPSPRALPHFGSV